SESWVRHHSGVRSAPGKLWRASAAIAGSSDAGAKRVRRVMAPNFVRPPPLGQGGRGPVVATGGGHEDDVRAPRTAGGGSVLAAPARALRAGANRAARERHRPAHAGRGGGPRAGA